MLRWVETSESISRIDFKALNTIINSYNNLEWIVSTLSNIINFLNFNITFNVNHELTVKLQAELLYLCQYVTYHSAHLLGLTNANLKKKIFTHWLLFINKSIY